MGELVRIADEPQVVNSTTLTEDEYLFFDTPSAALKYFIEIEGFVQVSGGGGGAIALFAPSDATGGYAIAVDGGVPQRKTDLADPVAGQLSNGVHHFKIIGVVFQGDENGAIGLLLGVNSQPGSATLARLPGTTLRVMMETGRFE